MNAVDQDESLLVGDHRGKAFARSQGVHQPIDVEQGCVHAGIQLCLEHQLAYFDFVNRHFFLLRLEPRLAEPNPTMPCQTKAIDLKASPCLATPRLAQRRLTVGNLCRHFLELRYVELPKPTALLRSKIPDADAPTRFFEHLPQDVEFTHGEVGIDEQGKFELPLRELCA